MAQSTTPEARAGVIARRLGSFVTLTAAETEILRAINAGPARKRAREALFDHDRGDPTASSYIVSGWAAHSRQLGDGRRQLIDLLLPGDVAKTSAHDGPGQAIVCISPVATIDGRPVQTAAKDSVRCPGIARAIALAADEERSRLMNQTVRLGRLDAYERMANLFIELHRRAAVVGLTSGRELEFPLTQEMLGDLLGLSVVHVNRTLQVMRRDSRIMLARGRLTLLDVDALEDAGRYQRRGSVRGRAFGKTPDPHAY